MNRALVLALGVAALIPAAPLSAQVPTAPRELGMGGAFMGVARGHESIFLAPGNLGLVDGPVWSLGFPQVAFGGSILGPTLGDLPDLVDFDDAPVERQDELLALIPAGGTQAQFSFRAPLAAFSFGGFGAGVQVVSTGSHTLSRDLAELFLEGYEDGRTDYAVGDTYGERATFWDFAGSYGRQIGTVSVGVTGHFIKGRSLVRTRLFEPVVDLEAQDVMVDYVGVKSPGGTGYSLDVGAAFQPTSEFTLSATVSNAFSRMTWDEELRVRYLTLDRDLIDDASPQDLLNRYEASEEDFDPTSAPLQAFEASQGLFDEAYFPTVVRVGAMWNPTPSTDVALDVHRKITEGRLADQWEQRFSLGVQQRLSIFALRAGYGAGNDGGNLISGGLSIGPLDLGAARYQHSDIDGDQDRGWIGTFGLSVDQPAF